MNINVGLVGQAFPLAAAGGMPALQGGGESRMEEVWRAELLRGRARGARPPGAFFRYPGHPRNPRS